MNFERLPKIEEYNTYLDIAFKRARIKSDDLNKKLKIEDKTKKQKILLKERVNEITNSLVKHLDKIHDEYPFYDKLPIFYQELFKCNLDLKEYRKSLASVKWAKNKILEQQKKTLKKLQGITNKKQIAEVRREFYGKISSFLKQIKNNLTFLENTRKTLKEFPDVKDEFTVVITGFPNVGKSTLLKKLTESNVEINEYPFTTKQILIGNMHYRFYNIQIIDVPGTLNRKQKNNLEKQTDLALKYLSDVIVYVFDLTKQYPLEKQIDLYSKIKNLKKQTIIYYSKFDLIGEQNIKEFSDKNKLFGIHDINELKKQILNLFNSSNKKIKNIDKKDNRKNQNISN